MSAEGGLPPSPALCLCVSPPLCNLPIAFGLRFLSVAVQTEAVEEEEEEKEVKKKTPPTRQVFTVSSQAP